MDLKGWMGGAKKQVEGKKATDLLEEDHDKVKTLFRDYRDAKERGDMRTKTRVFQEIDRELSIHSVAEEELFYPAVRKAEKDAAELVLESREEHGVVKTLLSQLRDLGGSDETFDAKMKVLMESVEHHIEEEEDELFPEAETMGDERLVRLGEEIAARKEQLKGVPVASMGGASTRGMPETAVRASGASRKRARASARGDRKTAARGAAKRAAAKRSPRSSSKGKPSGASRSTTRSR